ncbi:anoctamin-7-like isoform X2 [Actinia tenebrosa]|uniref:Anoctamin n=1 Tax=Actinia tenebrosa TaxID=6105 RepID=A0A6P8IN75_ACTTE|nr:anoctamin-7-like isoform X2 [Actinia tenebrosa]
MMSSKRRKSFVDLDFGSDAGDRSGSNSPSLLLSPHSGGSQDLYYHQADDEMSNHGDSPPRAPPVKIELRIKSGGLGFNIKGGRDQPVRAGDPGIYISRLRPGAVAEKDGRLKPGDKIVEINGEDTRNVIHDEALKLFRQNQQSISLLVEQNAILPSDLTKDREDEKNIQRIELRKDKKGKGVGLGFNIRGGRDNPYVPNDPSIYVTRIRSDGAAAFDGRLGVGDKILEINGVNVRSTTIDNAVELLQLAKKKVTLLVLKSALQETVKKAREGAVDSVRGKEIVVELKKSASEGLGFNIRGGQGTNYIRGHPGIFITSIKRGGVAHKDGTLQPGDRILEMNGVDVRNVPQDAAVQVVNRAGDSVKLLIEKNAEELFKKSEFFNLNFDEEDMSGEKGCYFRDGKRNIDFVLVYEEGEKPEPPDFTIKRQRYMENLKKSQLEFEEEISQDEKGKIHFIKCHVPWEVMLFYAEELSFRAPLKQRTGVKINWTEKMMKKLHLPNPFKNEVPDAPPDYFTTQFKANKLHKFINSDDPDHYFTDTERTRVASEILETACYGKRQKGEIGINRLVNEGVYSAAYPLHVGPAELPPGYHQGPHGPEEIKLNMRQILKEYWGRWGAWLKYQPLDHIRWYFGEKIGIYFAWLGQYTAWLIMPSVVGLLVFMYGVLTINGGANKPALDMCNFPKWTFPMCPACEVGCAVWDLHTACSRAKHAYLFDNPMTVAYAIFVSFWAVFFLEFWKRKEVTIGYQWDVLEFEEEEERPRPTFAALAPAVERNPITGLLEPYFPQEKRSFRMYSGIAIICGMVSLVMLFMVGVIVYKLLVIHPLYKNPDLQPHANQFVSATGAVLNLIIIMILSRVYEKLALLLNHWEMHRTQTEYEDNLTLKVFIFQFMNFYSSIFYIAFFKGKFVGYPGNYGTIFGLRNEECSPGGCLIELAQQLAVIMIGKQVIGNVQEVLIPEIKQYLKKRKRGSKGNDEIKPRWEADYELLENEGLFQEYLEMVIQFGFITLFVAAFPLAPFFALANNVFEIRIDSDKFVCDLRRSTADRAQDIGVWFKILDGIAKLAVISNAFLIAFTSEFLPKLLYAGIVSESGNLDGYLNFSLSWAPANTTSQPCRYQGLRDRDGHLTTFFWHLVTLRLAFVILFEHFVFGVSTLIDVIVPDIPQGLQDTIKREKYLATQALADHHGLMGSSDILNYDDVLVDMA